MTEKTVLILGGGIGGLVAANERRRRLPDEHRVVLAEKNPKHTFAPSYLWLMTGDRKPEQIAQDVQKLVQPGVDLLLSEVQTIDIANNSVQTSAQKLHYDYLIVALGAELALETIPGLSESAHTFYTFDGAVKLRDALPDFSGRRVAVVVRALPYKCR